ncbi:hypothetical protein E2C01_091967 [Portunus trituberculatus]|uniref:Uncharacterized protein n=1 Tax=Portunus trituberculatus TaxID=210409 RepID=A0A5B7JKE3_PORTR|nr:hypothetical protein [Portunus trituberculatus]
MILRRNFPLESSPRHHCRFGRCLVGPQNLDLSSTAFRVATQRVSSANVLLPKEPPGLLFELS